MSENIPKYNVAETGLLSRDELKASPSVLPCESGKYRPPTPLEIRSLIRFMGWEHNDVAKMLGVSYDDKKGSSTVRKWLANDREMTYSSWRLLLILSGVVNVDRVCSEK